MTASALARYPEQTPNTSEAQWKPAATGEECRESVLASRPALILNLIHIHIHMS